MSVGSQATEAHLDHDKISAGELADALLMAQSLPEFMVCIRAMTKLPAEQVLTLTLTEAAAERCLIYALKMQRRCNIAVEREVIAEMLTNLGRYFVACPGKFNQTLTSVCFANTDDAKTLRQKLLFRAIGKLSPETKPLDLITLTDLFRQLDFEDKLVAYMNNMLKYYRESVVTQECSDIHLVALAGQLELLAWFIEVQGKDISKRNKSHLTCLDLLYINEPENARTLEDYIKISYQLATVALQQRNLAGLKAVKRSDYFMVDYSHDDGNTLLHIAAQQGFQAGYDYLVKHGFSQCRNADGKKPEAILYPQHPFRRARRAILEQDLDVLQHECTTHPDLLTQVDKKHNNLLHIAGRAGNIEAFEYLVALGCNCTKINKARENPLTLLNQKTGQRYSILCGFKGTNHKLVCYRNTPRVLLGSKRNKVEGDRYQKNMQRT